MVNERPETGVKIITHKLGKFFSLCGKFLGDKKSLSDGRSTVHFALVCQERKGHSMVEAGGIALHVHGTG